MNQERQLGMEDNQVFHIHTFRCGHAELIEDEAYIKKSIEIGAKKVTFTDHAPFPGNPFGNRMKIEELDEYINTINELKSKYSGQIVVVCGLEIEYLPSFKEYYQKLSQKKGLEILLLGQHFYELPDKRLSFELGHEMRTENEWEGCGRAIIEGINSGLFSCVAHPDRIFRFQKEWREHHSEMSIGIINAAEINNVCLEYNLSSLRQNGHFRQEFWDFVKQKTNVIVGSDAHAVDEIQLSSIKIVDGCF